MRIETHPEVETWETRAAELIRQNDLANREFSWCFECALVSCFESLPKGHRLRGWCVDDFIFDSREMFPTKLRLSGQVYWLVGGADCRVVTLDIATNTQSLLYSYKFCRTPGAAQTLYVGRTYNGWTIEDPATPKTR